MFYIVIIFALVTFIIVMAIMSEHKETTFVNTIGLVAIDIYKWIKSLIPSNDICYPTGIGYDVNGCFCPGAVEKEFAELNEVLDGLYLENSLYRARGRLQWNILGHKKKSMKYGAVFKNVLTILEP